jgi:hypothetical protein
MSDEGHPLDHRFEVLNYEEVVRHGDREIGQIKFFRSLNKYGTPGRSNFRPTLDEARAALIAEDEKAGGLSR